MTLKGMAQWRLALTVFDEATVSGNWLK